MDTDQPVHFPLTWGEFEHPPNTWKHWRVGPLTLWIQRQPNEWRLAWQEEADNDQLETPGVDPSVPEGPPDTATLERVASDRMGERLIVSPRLADRSVVVRPETRFRLAPEGQIELFIGTPLWVHFETSEPCYKLLDIPTHRPSDSWFGPTTAGELCYAGRTAARLCLDNLPVAPHLAITRVLLRNRGDDDMLLERINLPVPNLALFAGTGGALWTQTVKVDRSADGKRAEVQIEDNPPADVATTHKLAEPRQATDRGVFSRALGALLG